MTGAAGRVLTDDLGKELDLWIADDQDVSGISEPTAKILSRRGIAPGATGEAGDVVSLAIAIGDYAIKQAGKLWEIKRIRKALAVTNSPAAQAEPVGS